MISYKICSLVNGLFYRHVCIAGKHTVKRKYFVESNLMESNSCGGITGLILARGGSVGVPLKNIKNLNGLPLIAWVLRALKDWGRCNEIWVSTENKEIASISKQFGAKIHWRPMSLAGSEISSVSCVMDFVQCHPGCEVLVLVQATSPFLQPEYLESAYEMILSGGYDSVFSVRREHKLRWKVVSEGETTVPLNFDVRNRPRRQDWNGELVECGMFYMTKIKFISYGLLQGGRCGYVEIKPEHALDIDSETDWKIAEIFSDQTTNK